MKTYIILILAHRSVNSMTSSNLVSKGTWFLLVFLPVILKKNRKQIVLLDFWVKHGRTLVPKLSLSFICLDLIQIFGETTLLRFKVSWPLQFLPEVKKSKFLEILIRSFKFWGIRLCSFHHASHSLSISATGWSRKIETVKFGCVYSRRRIGFNFSMCKKRLIILHSKYSIPFLIMLYARDFYKTSKLKAFTPCLIFY